MENEIWKPVVGYEDMYEVSNLGHIRGKRRGIVLRGFPNKNNYYHQVMLYDKDGKNKLCYSHLIVAQAFLPRPDDDDYYVSHRDGNKLNNAVTNIFYKYRSITKNIENGIADNRFGRMKWEYTIRQFDAMDRCIAEYHDFEYLEKIGYKRIEIIAASNGKKRTKQPWIYKGSKWSVERNRNNG